MKKTESKKTETKKTETKKPTAGTKRPFWDGRSRASTPGYRENYNSIFKQKKTLEGLLNDGYRTWENYKKWKKKIKRPSSTRRFGRSTKKKKLKI